MQCGSLRNNDEDLIPNNDEIVVALDQLPFVSMPASAKFSHSSDITFGLASDLMNCENWNPIEYPRPLKNEIPPPKRLPNNIEIGLAFKADVQLAINYKGGTDGYIDDGANCVLDSEDNQAMV